MRLLVFCATRDALAKFDMQPDWSVCAAILPYEERGKLVAAFQADENAKMAVDRSMSQGWRAPANTFILFDPSWPYAMNAPETIQATMRVDALYPYQETAAKILRESEGKLTFPRRLGKSPAFGAPYGKDKKS